MARLAKALLGAAIAAAAGAWAAPVPCRAGAADCRSAAAAEAEAPGLLLMQVRGAADGLSRGVLRGGGAREGDELSCSFGVPVTITSHRLMQLQDAEGSVHLHGNKQSWEQWTLAAHGQGDSAVSIVSSSGRHLGDVGAEPVLLDKGSNSTRWRVVYAGKGKVFLASHRNKHLGDWEGTVKVHGNMGEWEKWYINTADGGMACTSPQAEADECDSLRERMLQAEDLLSKAREMMGECGSPTTTTTTLPPVPPVGRCAVFGDPHFITFDGGHTTFVGDRILWVVRSRRVWMQAISRLSTGNFMGLAVGGPFLKGHRLLVYNASDGGPLRAEWDGAPILQDLNDEFHSANSSLHAWRSESWNKAMHDSTILELRTEQRFDIGPFPERFTGNPEGGLFLLRLPGRVEITITGVDFMSAVITMPAQEGGQSGYCGNFNGEALDDYDKVAPSWNRAVGEDLGPIPASMSLFENLGEDHPLRFLSVASEVTGGDRAAEARQEDLPKECPPDLEAAAELECARVDDLRLRQDCVFDICQKPSALGAVAEGMLATEVMEEKVNTQGAVVFRGNGRCLDSQGQRYAAFQTLGVKTEADCRRLLQELTFTKGVLGAELLRTSSCRILVDGEVDLTKAIVDGRWQPGGKVAPQGASGEALASGTGIISGATEDAAWSCWAAI